MEGSAVVEENHQRSDSTPISKSSGSLIRIDAISIDLAGAMANHHEARRCDNFSIRGYAAEMRKKDMSICFPFAFDGNQNKSEEQMSILPPLHVAKFRWWRCQNCQREIGATSAAEEIGIVPDGCQTGFISSSACSHMQSPSDAVMVLSDSQQAPELDNYAGRKTCVDTSTNMNRDEIRLSSCGYNKEKKDEVGHAAVVGYENGGGDDVNQEICNPTCEITEYSPRFQERLADGPDAFGSKNSGLVDFYGPSCGSHAAANIKNLECIGGSSAENFQRGTLTSTGGEQRIVSMACQTHKVVGRIKEGINFVKGQTSTLPSLDLEEYDNLSSESDEVLAENSHHDQHMDNSSCLVRQKTRKLRLLTELLGSKGNAENDHIRTEGGPSSVMPNISAGLDSVSDLCGHMAVKGSLKKCFGGPKGKRKMRQDKDWKALKMIRPGKQTKKSRVLKGDAVITNMSIVIADSESEEDGSARVDLEAGVRSQWTEHRMDRNLMPSKKKNRKTQLEVGHSPLTPQQEVEPKINQVQFGDAEKHCAADGGGFSKSANDAFINSRMEPYFILPPHQTERKSSLCKKKNKLVGAEQACLMPQRNSVLEQSSIMRKDLDIMETEPETVKLMSAHDTTARKGLDVSLNSYVVAQRNEKSCIVQTGDGADPLFTQLNGTSREDHHHQRKDIMHVGESSVCRKSAPDSIFRKGLLCDLNEKIAENGSFSCLQQLDFSGTPNCENAIEVQEQGSDDIPMEIVELLARNQYERCRHEAERNYFFSEKTNYKRNAELMGFPRVQGNGVLKSLQEENHRMRKPLSGMGMVTIGENVGSFQQNPSNCFSEIHGSHFNWGQLEGNSAFAGFSAFSRCQERQSGGVQKSDSGSIRNGNPQNSNWKGDKMASRFIPTKIPVLEVYNSCQNGARQSEAAEHVRSSLIPNHMPFGPNVPQKYANQSRNFEMHSQFLETPREGRMIGELDLNFVNLNANNLEKQTSNFDSESFRRASAEYPFACKHRGIDLNAKASGSLDGQSNETIPAMQLLSLMDAGMQSSSAFSLDGKPKFFTKPFFPCDHHPKVSLDGTSKILEKPLFPYHHHSKEVSGRGTGVYTDSSRHPSSAFYGKNHPSVKSCECSPAVPVVGACASLLQSNGNFKSGSGFTGHFSSRSDERGKALMQNRGRRSQKSVCTSGISGTSRDSNPIQDKQKGFSSASNTMVFPLQRHTTEHSTKGIDLEGSYMNGIIFPLRSISRNDICSINRNPADFTIPEAGNVYMISSKDLKFRKKISSKGRSGLINVDGRKRKRVTKLTTMKGHSQPLSSRMHPNVKTLL